MSVLPAPPVPSVDFVMPVYNEGENISLAVEEIERQVSLPMRLLVVYDFDEDTTLPVLERLSGSRPWIVPVKNTRGRGVLDAIRTGFDAAIAEVVIVTMADLSDDLRIAERMVELIAEEGYDVVCASRYMRGGKQIGGPVVKGWLSRMAGVSLYWLVGFPTHDATNAFRAYRRTVIREIPIESRGGFEYSLELTAKAWAAGYRVTEVPSVWKDRVAGASRFRLAKWLPLYLRWYFWAMRNRPRRAKGSSARKQ